VSLRPEAKVSPPFWRKHMAGLAAIAVGVASVVIAMTLKLAGDESLTTSPPLLATLPGCAIAAALAATSFARREGRYYLGIGGLLAAIGAIVFGWVVVVLAVVAVAAVVIAVLSEVL